MYQEIPPIVEDADTLKQQFTAERHPVKRQRLPMLYLLASRQATTRVTGAALLGLSRNTIGRWLTLYTTGGLNGLLQVYRPVGKPPALTADQIAQLQAKLVDPTGFATYQDIRAWINTTFGTTMTRNAVHTLGRYTLGAKPKVPRPTNPKKTPQP